MSTHDERAEKKAREIEAVEMKAKARAEAERIVAESYFWKDGDPTLVDLIAAALDEYEQRAILAEAHDRQPYPTADAYEKVCAALNQARQTSAAERAVIEAAKAWNQHREYLKGRYVVGDQISEADFDEADRLIQLLGAAVAALLAAEAEREK